MHFATAACNFATSKQTKVVQTCGVLYILTFKCCFSPQRRTIFSASELPKVVPDRQFFNIFTSECAFRHSGVQFLNIWTSKSGPGPSVFLAFLLPNVLFATAACNFWCRLWAPTSAPAALTGLLFDWPDTRIIEKTQHFATSLTFGADVSSFFWLSDYCIFCRLTWLLYYCFSTLHIVGSFYLNFLRLPKSLRILGYKHWWLHNTTPWGLILLEFVRVSFHPEFEE